MGWPGGRVEREKVRSGGRLKWEKVRVATWNVGSMSGRSGELVEVLARRKVDVCCIQETIWKGEGTKVRSNEGQRFKFFWQGHTESNAGISVLVAERWIDKVIEIKRVNEQVNDGCEDGIETG
jgi:exonuclease III